MRKTLLTLSAIVAFVSASFAQTGKNQLSIGPEVAISTASGGGTAFGGTVKYMHGVGTAGQVTLTSGALFDSETEGDVKATSTLIPIFLGYRHYFSGLFVEPQAGYLRASVKVKENGTELGSASDGSFGYGIGGGYAFTNGLDLGVSFRNSTQTGSKGLIVFRVAYNINLGGSSN